MRIALIAIVCLLVGMAAGLFYGWSTGFIDGQTHAMIGMMPVVQRYGAYRGTNETGHRDKLMDAVTIAGAITFSQGKSYSPMFAVFHPTADAGLINTLITWELDHPESPEFPAPDAPIKARIAEVKSRMKEFWDRELEHQKKKRLEAQQKGANQAGNSTATRVMPLTGQEPRPEQP